MAEIYCHGKTLLNALRAVWLEVGKALFGQATMAAPSAGSHGLLGGADAVRRKSQGY